MTFIQCLMQLFVVLVLVSVHFSRANDNISLLPTLQVGIPNSGNKECQNASDLFVKNWKGLTFWAQNMWDATAKSTNALISGNTFQFGDFDECLQSKAPFPVKYCLVTLSANLTKANMSTRLIKKLYHPAERYHEVRDPLHFGWCVPQVCSGFHLENSLNSVIDQNDFLLSQYNISFTTRVENRACQTFQEAFNNDYSFGSIVFCSMCLILFIITVISTIVDRNWQTKNKRVTGLYDWSQLFSMKTNIALLVKKQQAPDDNTFLEIITGLRPISILIVIAGHRMGTTIPSPIQNYSYFELISSYTVTWLYTDGDLYVDTFFIIGGIVLCYNLLRKLDSSRINFFQVIILRYLRLVPVHAFVVLFYIFILPSIGSGPMWKMIIHGESEDCAIGWWSNLLYINNYVHVENLCIIQTWYLQVDFQLFVLSTVILFLINSRRDRLFLPIFCFLLVLAIIIPIVIVAAYHYNGYLNLFTLEFTALPKLNRDLQNVHIKTHMRAAPYFIGIITGYLLYKNREEQRRISKAQSLLLLVTSIALLLLGITSAVVVQSPLYQYSALMAAFHGSLRRVLWAGGTVCLLYTVAYGRMGVTNVMSQVLRWSLWTPLTRLSYAMFMLHLIGQLKQFGEMRQARIFSFYNQVMAITSDYVITLIAAFIVYLTIEAPINNMINLSYKNKKNDARDTIRKATNS